MGLELDAFHRREPARAVSANAGTTSLWRDPREDIEGGLRSERQLFEGALRLHVLRLTRVR